MNGNWRPYNFTLGNGNPSGPPYLNGSGGWCGCNCNCCLPSNCCTVVRATILLTVLPPLNEGVAHVDISGSQLTGGNTPACFTIISGKVYSVGGGNIQAQLVDITTSNGAICGAVTLLLNGVASPTAVSDGNVIDLFMEFTNTCSQTIEPLNPGYACLNPAPMFLRMVGNKLIVNKAELLRRRKILKKQKSRRIPMM